MRVALVLICVLLVSATANSASSDRPTGKNCDLALPPASAGEETNHGVILRIYPRAKDIDSSYTGCQVLLAPDGEKWGTVSLTDVIKGDPIRIWSAYEKDPAVRACRFRQGKVVRGDPDKCPSPKYILIKSLAPGCVRMIQDAVSKYGLGAPIPPECEYQ